MRPSTATRPVPTDEDMQAAWQALRRRDWPSLAEIQRAAALYRLVRGLAERRASDAPLGAAVQTPALPAHPAPCARRPAAPRSAPPLFDHKRAASGERPDADD